jgi:hypothetical protein
MSLYGDVTSWFCSFCFVVSRHTNPSNDAEDIIPLTVLAGSTYHFAFRFGLFFLVWFCFCVVCLVVVSVCFAFI